MSMVVEGVEDAAALAALRAWGCDVAQGYHIARPMPAANFLAWLGEQSSRRPRGSVPLPRSEAAGLSPSL
jgi:EAL domain-containing protein (putative c-di-GMP-specific phosphodiesterase class I)